MEQLIIQSDINQLPRVEAFVSNICDEKSIDNYFGTIEMSVLQAVQNAIVHGNQGDASKVVLINCNNFRGGLEFTITDEGAGFNWYNYGDIPLNGGRGTGIFMMKMLADSVVYSDGGSSVTLSFLINGIEERRAESRARIMRSRRVEKKVNA